MIVFLLIVIIFILTFPLSFYLSVIALYALFWISVAVFGLFIVGVLIYLFINNPLIFLIVGAGVWAAKYYSKLRNG